MKIYFASVENHAKRKVNCQLYSYYDLCISKISFRKAPFLWLLNKKKKGKIK